MRRRHVRADGPRVAEGGEILPRVELRENRAPNLERLTSGPRTGEILTQPVSVPGAGRP